MKPDIRQANLEDIQSIKVCIDNAFGEYIPTLGRKPSSMNTDFRPLIREGHVFVIEIEVRIIAAMVLVKNDDHVLIRSVAVSPDFRKSGFGKQLLNFAEQKTRDAGVSEIRLYTSASLPHLIDYWAKLGFQKTECKLDAGHQRVFMSKSLQ